MNLKFDYSNLLIDTEIKNDFEKNSKRYRDLVISGDKKIKQQYADNVLGFLDLPNRDISKIENYVRESHKKFNTFVVLGIGGSALGNKAIYNALRVEKHLEKKVYVIDNVDPLLLLDVISKIDLQDTLFNCITKSGTTAETMSSFMIILEMLKKEFPHNYKEHIVITTDKDKGFLREVINSEGFASFEVPNNVGGRFSVLSDVGLLSSCFAGIDINELLRGANDMAHKCETLDLDDNPAYYLGLIHYLYMEKGYNISVMMPYSNSLYDFADWYRQLWAESLGKRYNLSGREVFVGQTPVKSLGTTDQHSQIQLYREGPNDKITTFIKVENYANDYIIPNIYPKRDEVNYLGGKKLSTLLNVECLATQKAMTNSLRPNCCISFPEINEYCIGQFIMLYEIMTVFTGALLEIDPLDQPGVEEGKIATYSLMGKKGF